MALQQSTPGSRDFAALRRITIRSYTWFNWIWPLSF